MTPISESVFMPPAGFQTSGGPGWKTEIVQLASGAETRNALWANPLRKWQLAGVPVSFGEAQNLIRFFNARRGSHQGFLFRDPFGYSSAAPGEAVTPYDEMLGLGDGVETEFRLSLDDGGEVPRVISRPVSDSVRIAVDGVEIVDFTLEPDTGLVTFSTPPEPGAIITAGFDYLLPVRFETDRIDLSQTSHGAYQLVRLALREVREVI